MARPLTPTQTLLLAQMAACGRRIYDCTEGYQQPGYYLDGVPPTRVRPATVAALLASGRIVRCNARGDLAVASQEAPNG